MFDNKGTSLVAPRNPSQGGDSMSLASSGFTGNFLPAIPKPPVNPTKQMAVVTPALAKTDLATKEATVTNVSNAMQQQLATKSQMQTGTPTAPQPTQPQTGAPKQEAPQPTNVNAKTITELTGLLSQPNVKLTDEQAKQLMGTDSTGWKQNKDGTWTPDSTAVERIKKAQSPQTAVSTNDTLNYATEQRDKLDATADKAYADYSAALGKIQNGTIPLTQGQQAQMSSLQASFDKLRDEQRSYNEDYVNGLKVLGARTGTLRFAPEMYRTSIKEAMDSGLSKIADIDVKASSAVADLQQAFMDSDYKMINAQYTALTDYMKQKNQTIKDIEQSVKDEVDRQSKELSMKKTKMDMEKNNIESISQAALMASLKADGSIDLDELQKTADSYGVDVNALYNAVLGEKDLHDKLIREESKFATDQIQAQAQLEATKANTAQSKASTAKTYSDIKKNDAEIAAMAPSAGEFGATVDLAAATQSSVYGQKTMKTLLSRSLASGDYKSAYQGILQATGAGLTAENRTKLENANMDLSLMKQLQTSIKEYEAKGGNMNLLKSVALDSGKRLGALLTDPEYAALAGEIDRNFQQYRQNMTGAAFGEAESADYAKVQPSKKGSIKLNMAVLDGATRYADNYVNGAIRATVGEGGIEIKEIAQKGVKAPDGNTVIITD